VCWFPARGCTVVPMIHRLMTSGSSPERRLSPSPWILDAQASGSARLSQIEPGWSSISVVLEYYRF
jgi:hypothetical protein